MRNGGNRKQEKQGVAASHHLMRSTGRGTKGWWCVVGGMSRTRPSRPPQTLWAICCLGRWHCVHAAAAVRSRYDTCGQAAFDMVSSGMAYWDHQSCDAPLVAALKWRGSLMPLWLVMPERLWLELVGSDPQAKLKCHSYLSP